MNKGIILVLLGIIVLGLLGLYAIQRGPSLFIRPPADERIAFVSDRDGQVNLWTMKTDGSDQLEVTGGDSDQRCPAWSPGGTEIASVSNKEEGVYQVYVSAWNGQYSHRVTASAGTKDLPLWSRGGEELTYIASGKVFVLNTRGGGEEQYLPPSVVANYSELGWLNDPYVYAAWSPDRKFLLCVQETDRGRSGFVVEGGSGEVPDVNSLHPVPLMVARSLEAAWAPSGLRVAVAYIHRDDSGANGLQVQDLEAMTKKDIFVSGAGGEGPAGPVWSPDGTQIAFEMWKVVDGSPDKCLGIYVVNAGGGKPRRLVAGDARQPAWSPDGTRLAYALTRSDGGRDIYTVSTVMGGSPVNLTGGRGDNYFPAWSPAKKKS